MVINYGFKRAREECRAKAIQNHCDYWPLAWDEENGFYCTDRQMENQNVICQVHKSGQFIHVEQEEYITKFRLTNRQHQIGQHVPEFIKSYHKPMTALEMLKKIKEGK